MFHSARFRLTFWYLIIIAFISFLYSGVIYRDVSHELERGFLIAEHRLRGQPIPTIPKQKVKLLLEEELKEAKKIVLLRFLVLNGVILAIAGAGGYILAGKTLHPIEVMVTEQKRFVADASHELRTPLTSLKTEIEVALRDKKLTLSDAKKLLQSNLIEVDKMKYFTDYLLSLSRYEANGHNLTIEKVDLTEATRQAIEANIPQAKEKNIEIKAELNEIVVKGNPQSLVELFSILINNAIKYSEKDKSISLIIRKQKKNAVFEIKDKGLGIAQKDIPHIFDRFYRSDASRSKNKIDGYGLGLSIAKSIVDAHKGEIKVKSEIGKGSTFTVFLPS